MIALIPGRSRSRALEASLAMLTETVTRQGQELAEARKSLVLSTQSARRTSSRGGSMSKAAKNEALWEAYKQITWISAPIDAIAHRMTSGGFELEPVDKSADMAHHDRIMDVLTTVNDEEDLIEILQIAIKDIYVFAEGYLEKSDLQGEPAGLYYIDPCSMTPTLDQFGMVEKYTQQVGSTASDTVTLDPDQVIRFVMRGPRGIPLSPIEKVLDTATTYGFMRQWWGNFFRHGAKADWWVDLGVEADVSDKERTQAYIHENIEGAENAHKHPVMFGGAQIKEFASRGAVDLDFISGAKFLREEFLTALGVPPSAVGVSDNGNRLTSTTDADDKQFRFNTVDPVRRLIEEKLTYRLIDQGFGYKDWVFRLKEADYRSDELLVKLVVEQVAAGLMNRNQGSKALGHDGDVGSGGDIHAITLTREVIPVPDLEEIHGSQFQAAQQTATQGTDPNAQPSTLIAPNVQQEPKVQEPKPTNEAAIADLTRWQRLQLRGIKKPFLSESIPPNVKADIEAGLAEASNSEQVRSVFDKGFEAVRLPKAELEQIFERLDRELVA